MTMTHDISRIPLQLRDALLGSYLILFLVWLTSTHELGGQVCVHLANRLVSVDVVFVLQFVSAFPPAEMVM